MLHRFLDYELDEERCELRSDGQAIAIQRRVFDLIVHILHRRDRVVSRQELIDVLWQGNVVSDAAISQVIMLARKALGDEGESQRVIKTVRGRGIRFVAEVESHEARAHLVGERLRPVALREVEAEQVAQVTAVDAAYTYAARASTSALHAPTLLANAAPATRLLHAAPRQALLGRDRELASLRSRLSRAEIGEGSLMLVEGDPGIGKSTLAEELARDAQERGFIVIWGRSWEDGGAPPFWPWIQVLRSIAQREGAESIRELLGSGAGELLPLLPEFGVTSSQRTELLAQDVDAARARFRQFDMMALLLRHTCGRTQDGASLRNRPRLIILEDLHAADDASVQLVRFLMSELSELGLFLLCTYRGIAATERGALSTLVQNAGENVLHLHGLEVADVYQLLARNAAQEPRPQVVNTLHSLSTGNPLLLSELCRRLDPDRPDAMIELSHLSDYALPERIAGAARRHVDDLPEATREALTLASALGREFSRTLLEGLLGCSESELLRRLAPAFRRSILRPAATSGRLLFSHALVCNAIYGEIPVDARPALHHRIAVLLERQADGTSTPLHELAHHYYLAAAEGGREKALEYAMRAAKHAQDVMAHEVAGALFDRAICLAEHARCEPSRLHELLCSAGKSWYRAGEQERAKARYERAMQLSRSAADAERFAEAVWLSGCVLHGNGQYGRSGDPSIVEALARLPEGDSLTRARLLAASSLAMTSSETFALREPASRAGLEMARRLGDRDALLWTLNTRHLLLWGVAPPAELVSIAQEMVELSEQTQEPDLVMYSLLWLATDYAEQGDAFNLFAVQQRYISALKRDSGPFHRHMVIGAEMLKAWMLGDLPRAREQSQSMVALGRRVQDSQAESFYALRTVFLDHDQGAPRALASSPFETPELAADILDEYRLLFANDWAERGYVEAARHVLRKTLSDHEQLQNSLRRPALAVMAQVAVALGELDDARRIYDLLAVDAGRHLVLQACVYLGPIEGYLGLLAAALGSNEGRSRAEPRASEEWTERARQHYERALATVMSIVCSTELQCQYGCLLAADPACAELAQQQLSTAADNARRLGMSAVRVRAESTLAALAGLSESQSPNAS